MSRRLLGSGWRWLVAVAAVLAGGVPAACGRSPVVPVTSGLERWLCASGGRSTMRWGLSRRVERVGVPSARTRTVRPDPQTGPPRARGPPGWSGMSATGVVPAHRPCPDPSSVHPRFASAACITTGCRHPCDLVQPRGFQPCGVIRPACPRQGDAGDHNARDRCRGGQPLPGGGRRGCRPTPAAPSRPLPGGRSAARRPDMHRLTSFGRANDVER